MKDDVSALGGRVLKGSASKHRGVSVFAAMTLDLIGGLSVARFRSTKNADASQLPAGGGAGRQVLKMLARLREQLALMESNQHGGPVVRAYA